jgi:kynurenine formamidase
MLFFNIGKPSLPCSIMEGDVQINFEKIIDLSYPVDEDSPREGPIGVARIYNTATMEKDGYFEGRIDVSGHYSTHVDAPALMYADGIVVADIEIEKLMGKSVLIDFSDLKPGDEITKELLEDWIRKHGDVKGMIVFLYTGMQNLANEPIFIENWIGLTAEAAEFLASKAIKAIGTDACNIDCVSGKDKEFPAHHTILRHGIPNIENLCNLDKLPTYGFYTIIAPMKLKKSSGAPARVIALV